jgi:hypothetical protein
MTGTDCQSLICTTAGLCTTPSPADGVKNDSETDVDCGGAKLATGAPNPASDGAPACADAKSCVLDVDCVSTYCSLLSHTCVDGQSCKGLIPSADIQDISVQASTKVGGADAVGVPDTNGAGQHAGIDTCGAGEATDAPALQKHESCCKSLLIPGTSTRLDKYEVTSGRVRQWVESINETFPGYNIRAWVKAQLGPPTTAIGALIAQQIPTGEAGTPDVVDLFPASASGSDPLNLVQQLGATTMDPGYPSPEQGCFVGSEAFGASTYWWDASGTSQVGAPPRVFTQDYYDIKPINCTPYWIAAAFCAWDGGTLPTVAETSIVYGKDAYPWGTSYLPDPYPGSTVTGLAAGGGNVNINSSLAAYNAAHPTDPLLITSYTIDFWNSNLGFSTGAGDFYFYPPVGTLGKGTIPDTLTTGTDTSPYIAAPGRFVIDLTTFRTTNGTEGWQDFGANMMEFTAVPSSSWTTNAGAFCDASGTGGTGAACMTNTSPPVAGILRAAVMPAVAWEGGSWEGHDVAPATDNFNEPMHTQYGKAGFRCARAAE